MRALLPEVLVNLGTKTMLDAPCGDFAWMKDVRLRVEHYFGADLVPQLIQRNQELYRNTRRTFVTLDLITDPLPEAELIFCRDCLVHFSDRRIHSAFANPSRSGATHLLTTTFLEHGPNASIVTGQWQPLNLELPPFNFPEPLRLLSKGCTEGDGAFHDKALG